MDGGSASALTTLEVGLIGPLELTGQAGSVALDRLQVRQVMALLAVDAGQVVSADELIDQIWPTDLPLNPRRALQLAISRLRSALGNDGGVIKRAGGGYQADPLRTDVQQFTSLIDRAEKTSAVEPRLADLHTALGLWRGTPLVDVTGPVHLDRVRFELEAKRVEAMRLLAEAELETGQPDRAANLLRPLVDEYPHDEKAATVLADALARLGRRRDALMVLADLRQALRSSTGIDPNSSVDFLERRILDGVSELRTPDAAPASTSGPFVGRERDLFALTEAAGSGPCVVVGEPGVGKSTLVERYVAGTETDRRTFVVRAVASPARPLEAISEVIAALLEAGARPETPRCRSALARVMPSLDRVESGADVTREDLIVELSAFIVAATRSLDASLVIEDLHHLDSLSMAIVEETVGRGLPGLVLTTRPDDAPNLARLAAGRTPATALRLEPFGLDAVAAYLTERGSSRAIDAATMARQSGGNPLFLRLLVDLDAEGALDGDELPATILLAVRERLDALSSRALTALRLASVLGPRFSRQVLDQLQSGLSADLDEAVATGLIIRKVGGDHDEFLHGLVADGVYQMTPLGTRVALHDEVGRFLWADGRPATEYVAHFTAAAEVDPVRAAEANLAAGRLLAKQHLLEAATEHFEVGQKILGGRGGRLELELAIEQGRVERVAAEPRHVETLIRAAELADGGDEPELFARAVIELCSHGGTTKAGSTDLTVLGLIERASQQPISDATRAELLAATSALFALTGGYRRGQENFAEARRLVAEQGDPELEIKVLSHLHLGLSHPDDFDDRAAAIDRLAELVVGDVDLLWEIAFLRFWNGFVNAEPGYMAVTIGDMRALAPRARHRHLAMVHVEAAYAHILGDLETAERRVEEAAELALSMFPESWALAHQAVILLAIRDDQGRLAELAALVDGYADKLQETVNLRAGVALIAAEAGDLDRARRELRALAVDDFALLARDLTWTATLCALGRVAVLTGERQLARELYDLLLPFAGRMSWAGNCTHGPVDRVLAPLAELLGDHVAAEAHVAVSDSLLGRLAAGR